MIWSRPVASVLVVALATMLVAGCARSARENPAPSGSSTGNPPGPTSSAPPFSSGTASPGQPTSPSAPSIPALQRPGTPGTQGASAPPAPGASPPPVASGQPTPEQVEKARKAYQDALAGHKASIDYSWLDVKARQAKIGADPKAIAAFVQNEIRYEAYAGALRGPRGALLSQAGNSIDRALLLADLLRAAGHRVRFAEGRLSAGQAEQLVRAGLKPPTAVAPKSPISEITERALGHFILLGNALDDAGFKAPTSDASTWDRTVREAEHHIWVQVESGGHWVDLDPSPGVAFGRSLVGVEHAADELDPKLFHVVEVNVEIETVRDGKRETQSVLSYKAFAADLAGVVVGFFHERPAGSATPVLLIGGQTIRGSPFDAPGTGLGAGIVRGLGPLVQTSPRVLTAEWLRIRVAGPSGERAAAYAVVDTVGPAARTGGQFSVDPARAEREVSEGLDAVLGITVAMGRLPSSLPAALMADLTDPLTSQARIRLLAIQGTNYLLLRQAIPPSFLDSLPVSYANSPTVVIVRSQMVHQPSARFVTSIDLTLKAYRVMRTPEDPLRNEGSFYDYLAGGVIDHTVERWILGAEQAGQSVGALFESAVNDEVAARVVVPGKPASVEYMAPDGRRRLLETLDRGQFVILPASRPKSWGASLGWWSVDPATGWTEDTTEEGYHLSTMPEYPAPLVRMMDAIERFCQLGGWVALAALMVHTLKAPDGLEADYEFYKDTIDQFCEAFQVARGAGTPPHLPSVPPPPLPKLGLPQTPYRPPFKDPGFPTRPPLKWLPGKGRLK